MSAFGGPNIITDGLVLSLDAGNVKSYPGTGTTWYDKSGNGNNGTGDDGANNTGLTWYGEEVLTYPTQPINWQ